MKKQISKLIAMGLAAATIMGGVTPVFAAGTETDASAALDPKTEVYTTTDAKGTGSWGAGTSTTAKNGDGAIDLTYDTTNGQWKDSAV